VYYSVVSRLKRTHLRFMSISPGQPVNPLLDLVLTSKSEAHVFGGDAVAIEDLDNDPLVMEGQLLSRLLDESRRELLIGIDPGSRIGLAVFYGGRELGGTTSNSVDGTVGAVAKLVEEVPHSSLCVKIGAGEPRSSQLLARALRDRLPSASIEIVDESGTSQGRRGAAGGNRDQRAAARIAFRKGNRLATLARSKKTVE